MGANDGRIHGKLGPCWWEMRRGHFSEERPETTLCGLIGPNGVSLLAVVASHSLWPDA